MFNKFHIIIITIFLLLYFPVMAISENERYQLNDVINYFKRPPDNTYKLAGKTYCVYYTKPYANDPELLRRANAQYGSKSHLDRLLGAQAEAKLNEVRTFTIEIDDDGNVLNSWEK
jgi:hypothetical protein